MDSLLTRATVSQNGKPIVIISTKSNKKKKVPNTVYTPVQPKRNAGTKFSFNQFANLVAFSFIHVHTCKFGQIG